MFSSHQSEGWGPSSDFLPDPVPAPRLRLVFELMWSDPSVKCSGPAAWPRRSEASCTLESGRCPSHSRLQESGRPCPASPTLSGSNPPPCAYPPPTYPDEKKVSDCISLYVTQSTQPAIQTVSLKKHCLCKLINHLKK